MSDLRGPRACPLLRRPENKGQQPVVFPVVIVPPRNRGNDPPSRYAGVGEDATAVSWGRATAVSSSCVWCGGGRGPHNGQRPPSPGGSTAAVLRLAGDRWGRGAGPPERSGVLAAERSARAERSGAYRRPQAAAAGRCPPPRRPAGRRSLSCGRRYSDGPARVGPERFCGRPPYSGELRPQKREMRWRVSCTGLWAGRRWVFMSDVATAVRRER
jgi:hypothetical protein